MKPKYRNILPILSILFAACSDKKVEQQTEFVAYTMAQFTLFDLNNHDQKYKEWLKSTFGASLDQVDDVLEYAKNIRSMSKLESDVNYIIFKNAQKLQSDPNREKLDDFMVNILTPYLWRSRNENPVTTSSEELINARYIEYFGMSNGRNGLKSLINSFNQYQNGGYYSNDSLEVVNSAIKEYDYYLKFDPETKYVCLFDIDNTLYSSNFSNQYPFSVYLIKRRIPCALPNEFGYSSVGAKDVVVILDRLENRSEEIFKNIIDDSYLYYSDSRVESIWRSIGLDMNLTKANNIYKKLEEMDFLGKTKNEIESDLVLETALHEAKHKYDEQLDSELGLNWDSEVSAHLTEIIYSNTPYHSLIDGIRRVEGFASVSIDSKISELLNRLWGLAEKASDKSISKDDVRKEVFNIYNQYVTYHNKYMTSIVDFEKIVSPKIWDNTTKIMKEKS